MTSTLTPPTPYTPYTPLHPYTLYTPKMQNKTANEFQKRNFVAANENEFFSRAKKKTKKEQRFACAKKKKRHPPGAPERNQDTHPHRTHFLNG